MFYIAKNNLKIILMKNILPFILIFSLISNAQVTNEGQPLSWSYSTNELEVVEAKTLPTFCLLYTSPSPRD